jgi:hypothetical protein
LTAAAATWVLLRDFYEAVAISGCVAVGEQRILKAMTAQHNAPAPRQLVNGVEDLIPAVFGHHFNKGIKTNHSLIAEMSKNPCLHLINGEWQRRWAFQQYGAHDVILLRAWGVA